MLLLTNGCSFTWGDELPGWENNTHQRHTFAFKLSQKLGMEYENIATCGAGNDKIFRDTLTRIRQKNPPTHVAVMWSAVGRLELFEKKSVDFDTEMNIKRDQSMTQFASGRCNHLKRSYRRDVAVFIDLAYNGETGLMKLLTYMNALAEICAGRGISLVQSVFHSRTAQTLIHCFINPRRHDPEFCWWVIGRIRDLPENSSLGIRYIGLFEELMKTPLNKRRGKFKDVWDDVMHIRGEGGFFVPCYDETGWVDMWSMCKSHSELGCKALEHGHPNEVCHTLMADRLHTRFMMEGRKPLANERGNQYKKTCPPN